MMVICVCFALALFAAAMGGVWLKENDNLAGAMALFFASAFIVVGAVFTRDLGAGKLAKVSVLTEHAIYETLSSVPDNGKYAVILREWDRGGNLASYLLDKNPPKTFKAINDKNDPYQSVSIPVSYYEIKNVRMAMK